LLIVNAIIFTISLVSLYLVVSSPQGNCYASDSYIPLVENPTFDGMDESYDYSFQ
jgi:hypothetical protein